MLLPRPADTATLIPIVTNIYGLAAPPPATTVALGPTFLLLLTTELPSVVDLALPASDSGAAFAPNMTIAAI